MEDIVFHGGFLFDIVILSRNLSPIALVIPINVYIIIYTGLWTSSSDMQLLNFNNKSVGQLWLTVSSP